MVKLKELLLEDSPGKRVLLLGNEAIARGILESGIGVVTTYPGTPASEVGDSVSLVAKDFGIYMEYSTNEKVAVEVAAGASVSGVRALTAMKHVGVNVAADMLLTLAYCDIQAAFILVTADDPNCYSSQNEQDNRYYALLANLPMLEPSNSQEAKDMVKYAVEVSEKLKLPCILRTTTRISHTRCPVTLGKLVRPNLKGKFLRDVKRLVMVPSNARPAHKVLLRKMEEALKISEESPLNRVVREGSSKIGVISSGAAYNYVLEAIDKLDLDVSVMKLGMTHPLPEDKIVEFMEDNEQLIVVEELEPYLELQARALAEKHALKIKIFGKMSNPELLPKHGEFSTRLIIEALSEILGKPLPMDFKEIDGKYAEASRILLPRPPILCPGCPHRASFYVIKRATDGKAVYTTDIGCYTLGIHPPFEIGDIMICMGASVGTAAGISKVVDEKVVAIIGDSTFFHAALPGLVNAVYNNHDFVLIVLDNFTTAMTGRQPHPGTGVTGIGTGGRRVLIENIAKGCGVEYVRVVNPFKIKEAIQILREAMKHSGPAVLVFRAPCALLITAEKRRRAEKIVPVKILDEKCTGCLACIKLIGCPAIIPSNGKVAINDALCVGCMLCAEVCPYGAIVRAQGGE